MSATRNLLLVVGLAGAVSATIACSLKKDDEAPPPAAAARSYSATASVGDFMTIAVNPTSSTAGTIAYNNISTNESGTVPYTVNADGSYAITDPQGVLVTAWEIPGFALIASSNHTGANNEPSLITAITSTPIAKSDIATKNYNYIQFRTNNGGMELGWVHTNGSSDILHQGYWPYGTQNGQTAFLGPSTFNSTNMESANSGNSLRLLTDPPDGYSYIFRTTGGFLAVDTGNGGLVCVQQSASKLFDAANIGSYKAVVYMKNNTYTDFSDTVNHPNGVEVGTPQLGKGTVSISSGGYVTVTSDDGQTLANNSLLVPLADTPALYDGSNNKLQDPCNGMFTFQLTSNGQTQDVFVTFLDRAILLASYSYNPAAPAVQNQSKPYSYFYGVALKTSNTPAPPVVTN